MAKDATRERLLHIATRLFAQHGYSAVTIRDIAREANASVSMVSYHFGGKDGLYGCVLQSQFACYSIIDDLNEDTSCPLEKIRTYVTWSVVKHKDNEWFSKLYIRELISPTEYHESLIKPLLSKSYACLCRIVEEAKSKGLINPEISSNAITHTIATVCNYTTFYNNIHALASAFINESPDSITDTILNIITKGILTYDTYRR